jgi:uncharacterized membrane protein
VIENNTTMFAYIAAWSVGALIFFGFVIVSMRRTSARYNANLGRIEDSISIQNEAIALQRQANVLLQEIRDSLRDK